MFKKRENIYDIEEGNLLSPKFDNDGLIPVITMCSKTKDILMHGYMNVEALKKTIETKEAHSCATASNCLVRYSWNYTPYIYYMVPSVTYPGQLISVYINPKKAAEFKQPNQLPVDMRIDDENLDVEGFYSPETNLRSNTFREWRGRNLAEIRNKTAGLTARYHGAGHSLFDLQTA